MCKSNGGIRAESRSAVEHRLDSFIQELAAIPVEGAPIIAVGHSHFFREFFRRYGETGARNFCSKVLTNCGVVAVTLEFQDGATPRIISQRLIFTSGLVERAGGIVSLLATVGGPRSMALASLGVLAASVAEETCLKISAKIVGSIALGLLLAQALQRFMFPKCEWTVSLLWLMCTLVAWALEGEGYCWPIAKVAMIFTK